MPCPGRRRYHVEHDQHSSCLVSLQSRRKDICTVLKHKEWWVLRHCRSREPWKHVARSYLWRSKKVTQEKGYSSYSLKVSGRGVGQKGKTKETTVWEGPDARKSVFVETEEFKVQKGSTQGGEFSWCQFFLFKTLSLRLYFSHLKHNISQCIALSRP